MHQGSSRSTPRERRPRRSRRATRKAAAEPPPDTVQPAFQPTKPRVVLVIACIDFRFTDALIDWLRARGLCGRYDLRTHEGAALAVASWLPSVRRIAELHEIEEVWLVDHETCGAYDLAGEPNSRERHTANLRAARTRVQACLGRPTRLFFHPLGADGLGAAELTEILP